MNCRNLMPPDDCIWRAQKDFSTTPLGHIYVDVSSALHSQSMNYQPCLDARVVLTLHGGAIINAAGSPRGQGGVQVT